MFTAIIPTMWKSKRIVKLLQDLNDCPYVGEIILIDNDPRNNSLPTSFEKIQVVTSGENMYVNAAWNYGAAIAKCENLLICNDDVNFDVNGIGIYLIKEYERGGIIGMASENYNLKTTNNQLSVTPMTSRPYGWGCIMLIAKANYVPIPDDLLIANGDDWLAKHATPYVLHGLKIESEISTTSGLPEFGMIQLNDNKVYDEKYR